MNKRHVWRPLLAWLLVLSMTFTSFDINVVAAAVSSVYEEVTEMAEESSVVTEQPEEAEESEPSADGTETTEITTAETETTTEESGVDVSTETSLEAETATEDTVEEETAAEALEEEDLSAVVAEEATEQIDSISVDEEATILGEIVEEREEDSKTFIMDNGTYMVAQYGVPVHYEDEDGNWQEIDSSLTDDGNDYSTTEKAGGKERVSFSKKLKEGKTVSIKNSNHPISWGLAGAEKQTITLVSTESSKKKGNNKFLIQSGLTQKVAYYDIYEGVDVEYIISASGVKENLILKKAEAMSEFATVYSIGKLTPVQVDEQTINLMDGENLIYQIQAPYMEDAVGERSEALLLSMEETKNKEIKVTLTADQTWLESAERQFPVTIDPYVLTETTKDDIDTTFITSGAPSTNYSTKLELLVGKESSEYKNCRTLVNINMPKLGAGDMVVDAKLRFYLYKSDFYASTTPELQVNAHQITEDWDNSTVTWNTRPDFDSTVLDYVYINRQSSSDAAVGKVFDITEAAKSWYENDSENYGILLKSYNESGSYADVGVKGYFWPERYNNVSDAYPLIQITYRNNKGLEDYWTYTSMSAGSAGTAYINDYSGNLVFVHDDAATTGEILPASLQHVYNGYMKKVKYLTMYPTDGRGWKLSVQQTLVSSSEYGLTGTALENYPYAYEDGDGTVHFFYKKTEDSTTKYLDEDGLGLELTISGSTKTITDKKDNKMIFDSEGKLTSIKDANNNAITLTYTTADDGLAMVSKITDGAGHVITLTPSSNGYYQLKKVTDPDGRVTDYVYSNATTAAEQGNAPGSGYLTTIKYPDGTSTKYSYDDDGALEKVTAGDGSGLIFTYTSDAMGKRVKTVTEFGTDGTEGQTVSFDRSKYNTTVIRTSGTDDVFGNSDDLLTTYSFDDYGRTIQYNTKTSGGVDYGGDVYTYSTGEVNSTGSNIKKINKVTSSSYSGKNVTNYLENHSAETDSVWYDLTWIYTDSVYTAQRTTSQKLFGNYSYQLTGVTIPKNGGGCYSQKLTTDVIKPGSTYTFSGYVKTDSVVRANNGSTGGYGANMVVRFTLSDGTYSRVYSDFIKGTTPADINDGWQRVAVSFTVPSNATETRVSLLLRNATGTAYFDGIQLEDGNSANSYNMFEDPSFEKADSSNLPEYWTMVKNGANDVVYGASTSWGSNVLKLVGEASVSKRVSQQVVVGGKESDIYVLSCWAKAEAVKDPDGTKRYFDMYARVYYTDGTSYLKTITADFNRDIAGWQKASMAFDLSDGDSSTAKTPSYVSIGFRYYKQANTVYFDAAQLVKDISNSYTYDSEGNIIKTIESDKQSTALTYNSNNDLTSVKDAKNNIYSYTYNDAHQVTEAVAPAGEKVQFSYNSTGSVTSSKITSSDESSLLQTDTVYNAAEDGISAGAYAAKETDYDGNSTEYDYDVQSGRLNSLTEADGTVTSYTYNETTDQLTGVSTGDSSVSYGYNSLNTLLKSITHNGFEYTFNYDKFGNLVSVSAGGNTLNTNTYTSGNGKLEKSTYGNGDATEYGYDSAGNVESVKINGETKQEWTYDSSQRLTQSVDHESGRKSSYDYDMAGRVAGVRVKDTSITATDKDSLLYESRYGYDEMDNLSGEILTAGGQTHTSTYNYDFNNRPDEQYIDGMKFAYYYDELGRLIGSGPAIGLYLEFGYEYLYSGRNADGESKYATTNVDVETLHNLAYAYTYDEKGNILTISEGTRRSDSYDIENEHLAVAYEYDSLNQLVREDNTYLNKTIVYSYDAGGNLTSKKEYAYTREADISSLTPVKTIAYGYDSAWKDKMVSYDGTAITYDAIGNPLSYRGKTMSWEGRRLESLTSDGTTIQYRYDADGVRTGKTVGSTESEYYYSNGKLAYEKRGSIELWYMYDYYGNLCLIYYHDGNGAYEKYFVRANIRGDIETIFDDNGNLVTRYIYDSWGDIISIVDESGTEITSASHIGLINPIRYRGYYYDAETGLYYLNSRYYDPEVGRFINADSIIDNRGVNTQNLFAYCGNNPINNSDASGQLFIGALVGGVVGGIMGGLGALIGGTSVKAGIATGALSGAAIGAVCDAVTTGGLSAVAGALICGAVSGAANWANQVANNYISNKNKGSNTRNKSSSVNVSNKKQNSTKQNNNQVANNLSASIAAVDYGSVVSSAVMATAFAPISYGANNLVGSVFNGTGNGGLNLAGEIIASTFMEVNSSMVQLVIDIFPK